MDIRFNELVVGEKSSYDFDVFLSGAGTYVSPKRRYSRVQVPGRNGELVIDEGAYENVDLPYKCVSYNGIEGFEEFRNYLSSLIGYQRIEDSFHPEEYRLGYLKEGIEPTIKGIDYDTASFELIFNCKPQRFLKDGELPVEFTNSGTLYNETLFYAKPLIKVYHSGAFTINGYTFNLSSIGNYSIIDCDIMDVYEGSTNRNSTFSGSFPILAPGNNTISGNGKIEIIPRWYTI